MDNRRIQLVVIAVAAVFLSAPPSFGASVIASGGLKVTGVAGTTGVVFPDNTKQTTAAVQYMRTVLVSPVTGGTAQDNGAALVAALNGILDASATNPYLLKIEPGIYDIGTSTLQMQQYVDIEGSGENTTVVQGTLDSGTAGVVNGASFAEIRFLTIKNTGPNTGPGVFTIAMYNNAVSPKITNVTAIATGSSTSSGTAARAFTNISSALIMTNVTAEASGAYGNVGIINISSATPGVTMTNVRATAKPPAGSNNYAVYNATSLSPVVMVNVTAEASGASVYNLGIYNNQASAILTTVTAKGTGGPTAYGVYSDNGSPTPVCTLCTVTIQNSMIMGSTGAIGRLNSAITTRVAGSQLVGAVSGGGVTCAGVYDEDYAFYASSCPP